MYPKIASRLLMAQPLDSMVLAPLFPPLVARILPVFALTSTQRPASTQPLTEDGSAARRRTAGKRPYGQKLWTFSRRTLTIDTAFRVAGPWFPASGHWLSENAELQALIPVAAADKSK
jgi:hypothetical protein